MPRTIIKDVETLQRELPTWYGLDFAFDTETTGLDYTKERLLGLALTFEDDRSYYIVCEHTVPKTAITIERKEVQVPTGEVEEYDHVMPSGKVKVKTRPVFKCECEVTEVEHVEYPTEVFVPRETLAILLAAMFAQTDRVMVAHNAKFDLHILSALGVTVRGRLADTMLAAQLIDENRAVGLKSLCRLVGIDLMSYQDLEHYPGFGKDEILAVPLVASAEYAMGDTEATWALWKRFETELVEEGCDYAFRDVWMPLLVILQEMEARGIAIDIDRAREARGVFAQRMESAEEAVWREGIQMVLDWWKPGDGDWWDQIEAGYLRQLNEIDSNAGGDEFSISVRDVELPVLRKASKQFRPRVPWFNVGSNQHLSMLLYDHMGLEPPDDIRLKRTAKGDVGVDRDTLVTLRHSLGEQSPKVLDDVLEYRKAAKVLSTYLDVYLERAGDGVIRTNFNQAVTDTGRLSSSSPNLQNQPSRGEEGKLIRDLFVAREGMSLVVADYSMMELRVAAHYSSDETMLRAFADGLDLHTLTASTQTGVPYEELQARIAAGDVQAKLARQIGKTSNFGLLYGMGAGKFRTYLLVNNGVLVTLDEAQALIDGFDQTFAGVTEWKQRVMRWAKRLGYVQTLSGRKRRLPDLFSDERWEVMRAERQAVNAIIQGSCSDIICEAMPHIHRSLRSLGGSLLLQVHDELVAEVPEQLAPTAAVVMEALMTGPANAKLRCPLTAEAGIGLSWGTAKH